MSANYPARQLTVPPFDVVLLRVTAKGMLLRGFQIHTTDWGSVQAAQEWWCEAV